MKKLILCGASCSGKTTLKHGLVETGLRPGISYTTREMRPGELDGQDYHFVSKEEFLYMIETGLFFEYDNIFGDYYGTSKHDFDSCDLFILTPSAIRKLKTLGLFEQCHVVHLVAPLHVRIKRASERGDKTEKILSRISRDNKTFLGFTEYHTEIKTEERNADELLQHLRSLIDE